MDYSYTEKRASGSVVTKFLFVNLVLALMVVGLFGMTAMANLT